MDETSQPVSCKEKKGPALQTELAESVSNYRYSSFYSLVDTKKICLINFKIIQKDMH